MSSGKHLSFILSASTKNIVQTNDNHDSVDVPYNLVIEDDQTFVMTDMSETDASQYNKYYPYRNLLDSEYYLASITLPKYSVSGRSITGNDTETSINYAVYTLDNTPIQSGTLSADNETYISLPAGRYRHVKIKLENVTGSLKTFSPKLEYVFNLSQPFRSGKTKDDATENKDPYGRLVNLSKTYVEILDNNNSVSGYIGIDKTTVESNRNNEQTAYSYYKYSKSNTGTPSGDFAYSNSDKLTITDDDNMYPARDEAAVRICDPSIKLWTDTEYYMKNKRFLDRSKYYENGESIPNENEEDKKYEFYSKIKSTAYFESDEDANITSFTVYTAVPDWLEIDYNDFTITNLEDMTISENGTERKLTANDLYDVATSGTGSSFKLDSSAPYGYKVVKQTFHLNNGIILTKEKKASIQLEYPVSVGFDKVANMAETGIDIKNFKGYTFSNIFTNDESLAITATQNDNPNATIVDSKTSTSAASGSMPVIAISWNEKAEKFVKSVYDPEWSTAATSSPVMPQNGESYNSEYSNYSYRLQFMMGSSYAKQMIIYDNLESPVKNNMGTNCQWYGTLQNVDTSGLATLSTTDNENFEIVSTVYYSETKLPDTIYTESSPNVLEELSDSVSWITASDYSNSNSNLSKVQAIAVVITAQKKSGSSTTAVPLIKKAQSFYVDVNMLAPTFVKNENQTNETTKENHYVIEEWMNGGAIKTYNDFVVRYARVDVEGNQDKYTNNEPTPSTFTTVDLVKRLVQLTIVKTDYDSKMMNGGTTEYRSVATNDDSQYNAHFSIYTKKDYEDSNLTDEQKAAKAIVHMEEVSKRGRIIAKLIPDEYIVVEERAPYGYLLPEYQYYLKIADNNNVTVAQYKNNTITDSQSTATPQKDKGVSISATSTLDGTEKKIANFIYQGKGEEESHTDDNTDDDTETEPDPVTVTPSTSKGKIERFQLEVIDEPLPGEVTLTKTDRTRKAIMESYGMAVDENGYPVAGAVYELYTASGSRVTVSGTSGNYSVSSSSNANITTDSNGKIVISGLKWGTYYFSEISAPVGYKVDDTKVYFSIDPYDDKNTVMEKKIETSSSHSNEETG